MHTIRTSTQLTVDVELPGGVNARIVSSGSGRRPKIALTFNGESVDAGLACLDTVRRNLEDELNDVRDELRSATIAQAANDLGIEV